MTTLPYPDSGIVHSYNCRRYVPMNVGAALWVAASLLILVAVVPGVIR
jgi:hypothetical protein